MKLRWIMAMVLLGSLLAQTSAHAQEAAAAIYLRADTNATTVWSPRVELAGQVGESVSLDAAYMVDAWTSASVDIVTAATKAVSEIRHEVNAGVRYEVDALTLGASYRYSTEYDYWSHGAALHAALDLFQRNTSLALSAFAGRDVVGRAFDSSFRERQYSLGGRLSLTQVLDRASWAQLSWESTWIEGFQASPYRYVALGGLGTCASRAPLCIAETLPERRLRHALVGRLRRALTPWLSAHLDYRFYFDSWRVQSQTIAPSLTFLPHAQGTLLLGYRYYTQGEASFYQPRYLDVEVPRYAARDRELSAFYSHRVSLEYSHSFSLGQRWLLTSAARLSGTRLRYLAFVGLTRVHALEATLMLALDRR